MGQLSYHHISYFRQKVRDAIAAVNRTLPVAQHYEQQLAAIKSGHRHRPRGLHLAAPQPAVHVLDNLPVRHKYDHHHHHNHHHIHDHGVYPHVTFSRWRRP